MSLLWKNFHKKANKCLNEAKVIRSYHLSVRFSKGDLFEFFLIQKLWTLKLQETKNSNLKYLIALFGSKLLIEFMMNAKRNVK